MEAADAREKINVTLAEAQECDFPLRFSVKEATAS
jgi:hypothetical protein